MKVSKFSFRDLMRIMLFSMFLIGIILYKSPNYVDLRLANAKPFMIEGHIFGCDRLGRDNWALFSYGIFSTLFLCLPARILTLVFAAFFAFLGYMQNGRFRFLTDVISSVFLALPSLLVALVVIAVLPPTQLAIMIAIVFSDWAMSYETLQGKLTELRRSPFIFASHSLGASSLHLFYFHFIPAFKSILEFLFITGIPSVIMTIALFSYLGIDTDIFQLGPGLGEQISFSKDYFDKTPVSVLLPILGIIGLVYSFGRDEK